MEATSDKSGSGASADYTHIEGVLTQLQEDRTQLEELWAARRLKLEFCLQLRMFEREALDVSHKIKSNTPIWVDPV